MGDSTPLSSRLYRISLIVAPLCLICALIVARDGHSQESKADFSPGETLVYDVQWEPPSWAFFVPSITAGEITLNYAGPVIQEGRRVLQLKAAAISSGFFPRMAGLTVNDSFESWVDTEKFCSLRMKKQLREGKRQRDVLLTFDGPGHTGLYQAYDVSKAPQVQLKNEPLSKLPECLQDVLSAIYQARRQPLKPPMKFSIMVGDDGRVKEILVNVMKSEVIEVMGQKKAALMIEAKSVFGGLYKESGSFYVWFSDDAQKIPLQFEAKIKLGKVSGTIKQIQSKSSSDLKEDRELANLYSEG